jgi:hypothetical protein
VHFPGTFQLRLQRRRLYLTPSCNARHRPDWRAAAARLRLLPLAWLLLGVLQTARADEAAGALYVRTDSDRTTVVSPRARASKRFGETTAIDVTYAADIWTSASIDIRTSASVHPVTEQRDELDVALSHDFEDLRLHGGYRFSTEHDYTSHGVTLGGALDFADNAATLDASLHVIADTVGQAGNPNFARSLATLDGTLSFTQVLDALMLMQLTYEVAHNAGYQSSPYRVVGVGGTGFGCREANLCLQERVPGTRTRHALALMLRRALSDAVSLGVTYRFYTDDWSLGSHTLLAQLGWNVAEDTLLALRYRFYTQGAAAFYKPIYARLAVDEFRTRDRELSKLIYQRAGVELEHDFLLRERGKLAATLAVSSNYYQYADFVGLHSIIALEISLGMLLQI